MRIVTVGDNCMDVYTSSGKAYPGGNPVNVSVYLSGLGAEAAYVGWVGSDAYGEMMIDAIREKGVDTSRITRAEGRTAVTCVEMDGSDRRLGDYDEGVNAQFSLTAEDVHFIQAHELVHSGIWGHADPYFALFKEKGLLTSFDFSDRLQHELTESLPPYVDYPFFSYTLEDEYIRQRLRKVQGRGAKIAVATLGRTVRWPMTACSSTGAVWSRSMWWIPWGRGIRSSPVFSMRGFRDARCKNAWKQEPGRRRRR